MDFIRILYVTFNIICFMLFLFQLNKIIETYLEGIFEKAIPDSILLPIGYGIIVTIINKLFFANQTFCFWIFEIIIALIIIRIYFYKSDFNESIKNNNVFIDIITIIFTLIIVISFNIGKLIGSGIVNLIIHLFNKFIVNKILGFL